MGFHLAKRLLARGDQVVGLDNLNDYYDVTLKEARLAPVKGQSGFRFQKLDLADREGIPRLFKEHEPEDVANLAAQAGVRHSLHNPHAYIASNLLRFANILA